MPARLPREPSRRHLEVEQSVHGRPSGARDHICNCAIAGKVRHVKFPRLWRQR